MPRLRLKNTHTAKVQPSAPAFIHDRRDRVDASAKRGSRGKVATPRQRLLTRVCKVVLQICSPYASVTVLALSFGFRAREIVGDCNVPVLPKLKQAGRQADSDVKQREQTSLRCGVAVCKLGSDHSISHSITSIQTGYATGFWPTYRPGARLVSGQPVRQKFPKI